VPSFCVPRRFIVALVLLCQVMTATLAHVPASYARGTMNGAVSEVAECPDHAHMSDATAADNGGEAPNGNSATHAPAGHDPGGCHSGACKCPCAHITAMACALTLTPSVVPRSRVEIFYREPLAPECTTTFFRPPI
jgi:hypothetical protein